jgi:hypothetical protein
MYRIELLFFIINYSLSQTYDAHTFLVAFLFSSLFFDAYFLFFFPLVRHGDQRVIIFLFLPHNRRVNWYNSILSRVVWQTFQIWYHQQCHTLSYSQTTVSLTFFDHRITVNVFCFKERIEYWSYTTEEKTFESWNGISFKYVNVFLFSNHLFFWQEFPSAFCLNFQIPHIYINDNWPIKVRTQHTLSSIQVIVADSLFFFIF